MANDSFQEDGPLSAKYPKEYLDPLYWKPECENFELVDWGRWESLNPTVPKVFDPPQRYRYLRGCSFIPLWWWHRSCYFLPCVSTITDLSKPKKGRISDARKDLFQKLLKPSPNPDIIPEPFRNKLFWTENNIAPETLISFNRWAWRSQSEQGRVIGLGNLKYDWTNDPTCFGAIINFGQRNIFGVIQMSPDGKWVLLSTFTNPRSRGKVTYFHMYVVQKGDEFKTPDGETIEFVKPGDLVRVSWNAKDPYEFDNDNVDYMYFVRTVATLENGVVVKDAENHGDLLDRVNNKAEMGRQTCCYCCNCSMSGEDRFDFQVANISDKQLFASSPEPPKSEIIDRL